MRIKIGHLSILFFGINVGIFFALLAVPAFSQYNVGTPTPTSTATTTRLGTGPNRFSVVTGGEGGLGKTFLVDSTTGNVWCLRITGRGTENPTSGWDLIEFFR